jgi:hypothetical protein
MMKPLKAKRLRLNLRISVLTSAALMAHSQEAHLHPVNTG